MSTALTLSCLLKHNSIVSLHWHIEDCSSVDYCKRGKASWNSVGISSASGKSCAVPLAIVQGPACTRSGNFHAEQQKGRKTVEVGTGRRYTRARKGWRVGKDGGSVLGRGQDRQCWHAPYRIPLPMRLQSYSHLFGSKSP